MQDTEGVRCGQGSAPIAEWRVTSGIYGVRK